MANSNFVVHNGLTVGPTTIDAASGNVVIPVGKQILIGNVILRDNGDGKLAVRDKTDNSDVVIVATVSATSSTQGNIQIGTNHIESINANGPISIRPNGSGPVGLFANTIAFGKGATDISFVTGADLPNEYGVDYIAANINFAPGTGKYVKLTNSDASTSTATGALIVSGGVGVAGNINAGNVNATNFTGTLLTASQPNITTLGGVTSIGASGTTTLTGILQTAAQTNVTSLGTLTSLGVGAITTTGTLALNAAGGLTTNQTTFLLANATATTVNIGGAATTLNIGATTGTLNLNNALITHAGVTTHAGILYANSATASTSATTGGLVVAGGVGVAGNINAGSFTAGNVSVGTTADAITSTGTLTLDPNPVGTGGLVVIQGNLQVTGTTTTINSATLDVTDLNITVAKGAANAAAANGAGLTVDGASATMLYTSTTDTFNFNKGVVANLTGNTAGTHTGAVTGNASTATALQTARAINGVSFDGTAAITVTAAAGTLSGATLASGVTASSLTSVGTLTALAVSGVITSTQATGTAPFTVASTTVVTNLNADLWDGNHFASYLNQAVLTTSTPTFAGLTTPSITHSGTNGVGDIGGVGATFATVYATTFSGVSTTAKYADLAENYQADAEYAPGTVVHFGGEFEVTACDTDGCTRVAGIVSTNPAHLMNTGLEGANVVALALTGRVPCLVQGTVRKGDLMVSAGNGRARAEANPKVGSVIGKALANSEGDAVIEVVVGIR
jgi:hypothetical protein